MKVLVSERLAPQAIDVLEDRGHHVDVILKMTPEELVDTVPYYDALIVRSVTQVTREVLEAGHRLKVVGRAGVGLDNINVPAATERGVIVCNAPVSNIVSAAEHTMALMLSLARNIPQANASMKNHKWERTAFVGSELQGKTLAIFGLGRIGGLVAERAAAFGMKLIGYDPYCSNERAQHLGVTLYDNIDEICPLADFITVHLPKTKETTGMFGPRQFAIMKDGVYLINAARGGIFNEASLADFVAAGKIGGVALDVYEEEPCTDGPLHEFDNVIMTPHLGASTVEAQVRAGVQIAEYVSLALEGRMVPTAVNMVQIPGELLEEVGPYIAACQMAGSIIGQLASEGISTLNVMVKGPLSNHDVHVFGTAALQAIFAESSDDPVNFVNANFLAEQRGVEMVFECDPESGSYTNAVTFEAHCGGKTIEIGVTIGVKGEPRIISLMGYNVDLTPEKYFMILRYEDKPGKLGIIGTVTGKHAVNISTMQMGVNLQGSGISLVFMNVDREIPESVKKEIAMAVEVEDAWYLQLHTGI